MVSIVPFFIQYIYDKCIRHIIVIDVHYSCNKKQQLLFSVILSFANICVRRNSAEAYSNALVTLYLSKHLLLLN